MEKDLQLVILQLMFGWQSQSLVAEHVFVHSVRVRDGLSVSSRAAALPEMRPPVQNARALAGAQEAARGLPADVAQRYLRAASARIEFACEPPLADAARLKGLQGSVRSLLWPNKEPCGNRVVMSSTIHLSPPVLRCVADPVTHLPASMRDMFTPMEAFGAGGGMLAKKLMHAFAEAAEGRGPGRPLYPICEAYVLHEVDLGPPPRTPQAVAKVFG